MVETLTESFCERCGTRYEFRAPTRLNPLRKTRGLIGGLRNYLTSQDALSDALGDAMRSEEDQLAAAQLDAFHETFNFCIGCRQYTCLNCWNDGDGRCRTCAPIPGTDDLTERLLAVQPGAAPIAAAAIEADVEPMLAGDDLSRRLGLDPWPTGDADVAVAPVNGDAAHAWPEPGVASEVEPEPSHEVEPEPSHEVEPEPLVAELAPEEALQPEPEPIVAVDAEPEPEPTVAVEAEPEPDLEPEPVIAEESQPWLDAQPKAWPAQPTDWPTVAEPEPGAEPFAAAAETEERDTAPPHLRVVAWEADSAYDVVDPVLEAGPAEEPIVAAEAPEPEPIVAEAAPEPETMVAEAAPEPEPMVAEAAPEPEPELAPEPLAPAAGPAQAMPQVAPISETILHFPDRTPPDPVAEPEQPAVAAEADSPELAARRAQLDLLGLGDPGEGPVGPERPAVLPYRSRGAAVTPVELAMRAGGPGFWEASAREVAGAAAAQVGVQNCGECGLSLSATARFCRRCGTRQARSA